MEYAKAMKELCAVPSQGTVEQVIAQAKSNLKANLNSEVYEACFSSLDLTSLSNYDSCTTIEKFVTKTVGLHKFFPEIKNIAAICLYPNFVETAGLVIGNSDIAISSVSGNYPSAHTFLEVKMLETAMTAEQGADEIETAVNAGEIADGQYELAGEELKMLRDEAGEDILFKVAINTCSLTLEQIYKTTIMAITAGADFIKITDTVSAVIACFAIKEYFEKRNKKIGIKVAGNIKTVEDAVAYYTIVQSVLGSEWIEEELFRIEADTNLANNLLSAITNKTEKYF